MNLLGFFSSVVPFFHFVCSLSSIVIDLFFVGHVTHHSATPIELLHPHFERLVRSHESTPAVRNFIQPILHIRSVVPLLSPCVSSLLWIGPRSHNLLCRPMNFAYWLWKWEQPDQGAVVLIRLTGLKINPIWKTERYAAPTRAPADNLRD